MNSLLKKLGSVIEKLASWRLFKSDFDYHLVRASMVFIFLIFGYQKWFQYEADTLIPYIRNGPLIFWMYPRLRRAGGELVPGRFGMAVWRTDVPGILE
jgi:uncharacterized membrane protein YkgB